MDVISRLVRSGDIKPLKLSVLLNSLVFLSQHCNSNHITINDVKESVSFHILSGAEFDLYVSLIIESVLVCYLYIDGSIRMKLKLFNGDEVIFLNDVFKVLASRNQSHSVNNINSLLQLFNENVSSYSLERSKNNFRVKWSINKGSGVTSTASSGGGDGGGGDGDGDGGGDGGSGGGDDSSVTLVKKYSQILINSNNNNNNNNNNNSCSS